MICIRPKPKTVFIRKNSELEKLIAGFQILLHEAHKEPNKCKQLVIGYPHVVGIMDAAIEGTGGVVMGKRDACIPKVFRLEWPQITQDMVYTWENPDGPISNSDLVLAGLLICWLVMEEVALCLRHKHMSLYRDNSAAISWVLRMATRSSKVAGPLLMALALRLKYQGATSFSANTPPHCRSREWHHRHPLLVVW